MYDPIKAVKNIISVPRKSHIPSFEFGIGIPIFRAEGCALCDIAMFGNLNSSLVGST
ncbi:MAG: hypothetical protein Fues2KO_08850 [Fuerstiella sp.]